MKTSEVLLVVAKELVANKNCLHQDVLAKTISKKYKIGIVQLSVTIQNMLERGYLNNQSFDKEVGLSKKSCDFIREYNKLNQTDKHVCDGCGKDCTPEEIDNPLGMCASCVAYEVDEQNNGDKDIPEEGWEVATEKEYNS